MPKAKKATAAAAYTKIIEEEKPQEKKRNPRSTAWDPDAYNPNKYKIIHDVPDFLKGPKAPKFTFLHYPFDAIGVGDAAYIPVRDEAGELDPNANMSRINTAKNQYLKQPKNEHKSFTIRFMPDTKNPDNKEGLGYYLIRTADTVIEK